MTSVTTTRFLILLGAPGSGKGTQAVNLRGMLGMPYLASGDVFRSVRQEESDLGRLVRSYYDKGLLIPDDLTIRMMLSVLSREDYSAGATLDGFPRTIEQARALDADLAASGKSVWKVIYLHVAAEKLVERIAGRWLCLGCNAVYHQRNRPPKVAGRCDVCGGELYQRPDDTEETVRTRLAAYFHDTKPLVNFYKSQGKLCEIDGGRAMDDVARQIATCVSDGD